MRIESVIPTLTLIFTLITFKKRSYVREERKFVRDERTFVREERTFVRDERTFVRDEGMSRKRRPLGPPYLVDYKK